MACKLDTSDCVTLENAIFKLNRYSTNVENNIEQYIEDYGEDNILTRIERDNFKEISKIGNGLLEIQDKCGCRFSRSD